VTDKALQERFEHELDFWGLQTPSVLKAVEQLQAIFDFPSEKEELIG
jgi:hypothetical protein